MKTPKIVLTLIVSLFSVTLLAKQTPATSKPTGSKPVTVIIDTNYGKIEVELDSEKAPKTVANFMSYVDRKFYDDLVFHRVIDNFMIQGGGFDKSLKLKPTDASIKNEAHNGLKNKKGTIAMARTPDPDSASSQFFINLVDNDNLNYKNPADYGYAVFGKVTNGIDVVETIGKTKTGYTGGMGDVPSTPVMINSIRKKDAGK